MEIALYGGTFDPPTNAHHAILQALLEEPSIDAVWAMPSGFRNDKLPVTGDFLRMQMLTHMCRQAFPGEDRLQVTNFELLLPRPTNTYRTLTALQETFPHDTFWFVFGADSVQTMPHWEHGNYLYQNLGMIVVPRPGYIMPAPAPNIRNLKAWKDTGPDISSTRVRAAVAAGISISGFVHPVVQDYIRRTGLYSIPPSVP